MKLVCFTKKETKKETEQKVLLNTEELIRKLKTEMDLAPK
jgi:hypothetical protein